MLLLAIMAFVISLTSAAALASASVSNGKSPNASELLATPRDLDANHIPAAHPKQERQEEQTIRLDSIAARTVGSPPSSDESTHRSSSDI
jgi:hypothetical protein